MKKILSFLLLLSFLVFGATNVQAASLWTKYVSSDKSFSLHYPTGWKITSDQSIVNVENSKSGEQLTMIAIPFDQQMSPKEIAESFLDLLKEGNSNLSASDWLSAEETKDSQVVFNLTDKVKGKAQTGLGIVMKTDQQAYWFSYFAPTSDYYQIRGFLILEGFIESLTSGTASKAPDINYNVKVADRIDKNAKAFLFVVEFTLGAPFTQSQENTILMKLKESWRYLSEEELKEYDQYPTLVKSIMKMKQKQIEKLRGDLEKTINEWINESDKSDKVVKIINSTLKNKGKVVIKGEPSLTEMSLTAYSEIIAYSRLLQEDSKAKPDQISQKTVTEIKKQVKKAWKSFTTEEKEQIATTPGLWVCLRMQFKNGTKKEQDKIRENLKKIEEATRDIGTSNTSNKASQSSKYAVIYSQHMLLMQMRQQTFNTYAWAHGFNYLPYTGKLW